MMNRLSIEFESASSLLSTTGQVQTAGFPIVSRISGGIERACGSVVITVHISIVIRAVPVMRQTETDLAGAVAVGMLRGGHWWARVRMCVTEAVAVRRRREMT